MAAKAAKRAMTAKTATTRKTIVFLHPDLGIGGAERLVIDAAVGLQKRGHKVVVFTSYCDPGHCFNEARDGTLDVRVRGDKLFPSSFLKRFSILCAILRQVHLICEIWKSGELQSTEPDVFFVDQLSAGLPLLRLLHPRGRIFFYCHFPDKLLVQDRRGWLVSLYRLPFDRLEDWSMSFAHAVAVNSDFTKAVVCSVMPYLARRGELRTVYPCVDTAPRPKEQDAGGCVLDEDQGRPLWGGKRFLLSINRFERKKNVALAIKAYAALGPDSSRGVRLVVAGGYDARVAENVGYHAELAELANRLSLRHMTVRTMVTALEVPDEIQILFCLSVPQLLKDLLLRWTRLLVYTPANEHFGIVPLEAMLAGVPVLAANTGGPTETVVEGKTGWLRSPDQVSDWAEVMDHVLYHMSEKEVEAMKRAGVARVRDKFGGAQMAERLDGIMDDMLAARPDPDPGATYRTLLRDNLVLLGVLFLIPCVLIAVYAGKWLPR